MDDDYRPFRWDLSKREQLPKISVTDFGVLWPNFEAQLRACAAQVIAAAGNTNWVFVGRSPEHLFDYLSGIFEGMPNAPSLTQLIVSMSSIRKPAGKTARRVPDAYAALASYFAAERLDPIAIASYGKAVTFIDVVSSGRTFGQLVGCLRMWAKQHKADWNAVQRRLRFVGLVRRGKTSPRTWRWQQHQDWLAEVPGAKVRNVSVAPWVFDWMGSDLVKLTPSHTPDRWTLLQGGGAPRGSEQLAVVQIACRLYDLGRMWKEQLALAATIAKLPDMRDPWLRALVLKLRRRSRPR
jgi:hypothetical protein